MTTSRVCCKEITVGASMSFVAFGSPGLTPLPPTSASLIEALSTSTIEQLATARGIFTEYYGSQPILNERLETYSGADAPLEAITVPLFPSVANKSLFPTASAVIKDAG